MINKRGPVHTHTGIGATHVGRQMSSVPRWVPTCRAGVGRGGMSAPVGPTAPVPACTPAKGLSSVRGPPRGTVSWRGQAGPSGTSPRDSATHGPRDSVFPTGGPGGPPEAVKALEPVKIGGASPPPLPRGYTPGLMSTRPQPERSQSAPEGRDPCWGKLAPRLGSLQLRPTQCMWGVQRSGHPP